MNCNTSRVFEKLKEVSDKTSSNVVLEHNRHNNIYILLSLGCDMMQWRRKTSYVCSLSIGITT